MKYLVYNNLNAWKYFWRTTAQQEIDYLDLIKRLDIQPSEFFMIGNSLKSDVLPVLNIGGHGIHIPFHTTWAHERIEHTIEHENFRAFEKITEVLQLL